MPLKWLAAAGTGVVFIQLVVGALMRHTESGLAIPDFPLAFGRLIPPFSELTVDATDPFPISIDTYRTRVGIHFCPSGLGSCCVRNVGLGRLPRPVRAQDKTRIDTACHGVAGAAPGSAWAGRAGDLDR